MIFGMIQKIIATLIVALLSILQIGRQAGFIPCLAARRQPIHMASSSLLPCAGTPGRWWTASPPGEEMHHAAGGRKAALAGDFGDREPGLGEKSLSFVQSDTEQRVAHATADGIRLEPPRVQPLDRGADGGGKQYGRFVACHKKDSFT